MGFFGGDNDTDSTNDLIEQQINDQNAQVEREKQSLMRQRIAIVKSQGGMEWKPEPPTPDTSGQPSGGGGGGRPHGGVIDNYIDTFGRP